MKKLNWREFDSCVYITVLLDVLVNFVRSTIKNYPDKLFPKQPNVNILSITYTRVVCNIPHLSFQYIFSILQFLIKKKPKNKQKPLSCVFIFRTILLYLSRLLNYANSYCTFNFRLSCLNNLLSIAFCVRYFK